MTAESGAYGSRSPHPMAGGLIWGNMISRYAAMNALKQLNYERHSISPSINGYNNGISINVYFAGGISGTYAYGENGSIHGYIAPVNMLHNHKAIRKMIGYSGTIIVLDSEGNHVGN